MGWLVVHERMADQIIEDVSLMNVDGDEGLILDSLNLTEVLSCHFNQCIEQIQEESVCLCHHFLVGASIL